MECAGACEPCVHEFALWVGTSHGTGDEIDGVRTSADELFLASEMVCHQEQAKYVQCKFCEPVRTWCDKDAREKRKAKRPIAGVIQPIAEFACHAVRTRVVPV